jgi:hypothetical protein
LRGKLTGFLDKSPLVLTTKRLMFGDRSTNLSDISEAYAEQKRLESELVLRLKNGTTEKLALAPESSPSLLSALSFLSGDIAAKESESRAHSKATVDRWVNAINQQLGQRVGSLSNVLESRINELEEKLRQKETESTHVKQATVEEKPERAPSIEKELSFPVLREIVKEKPEGSPPVREEVLKPVGQKAKDNRKTGVTPRKVLGYVFLSGGVSIFAVVIVTVYLLAEGVLVTPIIAMPNPGYGNDVFAGLFLEIGLLSILTAVAFGICKIGVDLSKN